MRTNSRTVLTAAVAALSLVAGCGGGSSTSPETFWADLETAVADFAAELDEIDADYLGRSWDVPDEPGQRADTMQQTSKEISEAYTGAWQDYVDRLAALEPPEGYPEAGEGYAEGLPDYYQSAIVDTERAALAATSRQLAGDPAAFEELLEVEDALANEWELFGEGAEAVGHPIADVVELRTGESFGDDDVSGDESSVSGGIGSVLQRANDLLFAIEDAAG
jgi:hypothetical protein